MENGKWKMENGKWKIEKDKGEEEEKKVKRKRRKKRKKEIPALDGRALDMATCGGREREKSDLMPGVHEA